MSSSGSSPGATLTAVAVALTLHAISFKLGWRAADEAKANRALSAFEFTDAKLGGYPFFECGASDWFNSEFTATNRSGKPVQGAVCCGLWRQACTVRFE